MLARKKGLSQALLETTIACEPGIYFARLIAYPRESWNHELIRVKGRDVQRAKDRPAVKN